MLLPLKLNHPSLCLKPTAHPKYSMCPNRGILHHVLYFNKLLLAHVRCIYSESKAFPPRIRTFLLFCNRQKYNQNVTKAIESPADRQRNKNPLVDASGSRPVKLYLNLPALGFLQKQMKSLHRACIPGIMNSFWFMLFKKVYSCIQNTSS